MPFNCDHIQNVFFLCRNFWAHWAWNRTCKTAPKTIPRQNGLAWTCLWQHSRKSCWSGKPHDSCLKDWVCVLNSTECMEASRNYTRNSVIMSWFIVQVNQSLLSYGSSVEKNMMHSCHRRWAHLQFWQDMRMHRRWVKHQIYITCICISTGEIDCVIPCWGACLSFCLNLRCLEWLTLLKPAFFEHSQQTKGHHISSASWIAFIQSIQSFRPQQFSHDDIVRGWTTSRVWSTGDIPWFWKNWISFHGYSHMAFTCSDWLSLVATGFCKTWPSLSSQRFVWEALGWSHQVHPIKFGLMVPTCIACL